MTDSAGRSSSDRSIPEAVNVHQDDSSEVTPPATSRRNSQDLHRVEKTLKFRFFSAGGRDQVDPAQIHLHWIQAIQEQFGTDVQIMNNNGQVMPKVDTIRWTIGQHKNNFKIHQTSSRTRIGTQFQKQDSSALQTKGISTLIIHRVRTSVTLQEMKGIPKVMKLLQEHHCFMTEHRWTEDVWDTTQLGFFCGLDPQVYDVVNATEKVRKEIKDKLPQRTKLPKFQLTFTTPQIKHSGQVYKTKAYAIETTKQDSIDMLRVLKQAYRDNNAFVPFQMRTRHPEAYARYILRQTKSMSDHHVIMANNISIDAMYYLADYIKSVDGVIDIVPSTSVMLNGRHKLMVNKHDFYRVRKEVMSKLSEWYEAHVPEDAKTVNRQFPDPPEIAPLFSDGYSSGDNTYMSDSVNTAMSYPVTLFEFETDTLPPGVKGQTRTNEYSQGHKSMTWAQRVQKSSMSTAESPDTNSFTQSTVPDEDYVSDLASSRAEVEELKQRVQQYEQTNEQQKREFERQTEQQRREMEIQLSAKAMELERSAEVHRREIEQQAIQQKREMERQVEEQRREMEHQLTLQRQDFERRVEVQRNDMERLIARQVQDAISDTQRQHQQATASITNADQEFRAFMTNNNRHMQMLTEMVMQMMGSSIAVRATSHPAATPGEAALRSVDSDEEENENRQDEGAGAAFGTARKRRNTRISPQKVQASRDRNIQERPLDTQPLSPIFAERTRDRRHDLVHGSDRYTSTPSPDPHHPDPPSPIYPDHPDHPLYGCHPELSIDSSGLVAAAEASSPIPVSPFELQHGELNDTDMSNDFLRDIHEQHQHEPQRPPLNQSADIHEEMENAALRPVQEDNIVMTQTTPGESSALNPSQ